MLQFFRFSNVKVAPNSAIRAAHAEWLLMADIVEKVRPAFAPQNPVSRESSRGKLDSRQSFALEPDST
jgi:hypothetical protein